MRKSHRTQTAIRHHALTQPKQSNQLSLPHQDDCKPRRTQRVNNKSRANHRTPQTMGASINNKLTTKEPPPFNGQQPKPLQGLNTFYWYQIFALDFVIKTQKMFSSHGGFLTIAMYHHRETI